MIGFVRHSDVPPLSHAVRSAVVCILNREARASSQLFPHDIARVSHPSFRESLSDTFRYSTTHRLSFSELLLIEDHWDKRGKNAKNLFPRAKDE
jgi:hypothetical protein